VVPPRFRRSRKRDPFPRLKNQLIVEGIDIHQLKSIEEQAEIKVKADYQKALLAEDPKPEDLFKHDFAPTSNY
jgi:2-oxoisovalerate dehydrogenase E1 component